MGSHRFALSAWEYYHTQHSVESRAELCNQIGTQALVAGSGTQSLVHRLWYAGSGTQALVRRLWYTVSANSTGHKPNSLTFNITDTDIPLHVLTQPLKFMTTVINCQFKM